MEVKKIFEKISNLKIEEICELIDLIEKKYKINKNIKKNKKKNNNLKDIKKIYLTDCGVNKIQIIKLIKEIKGISLLEAKKKTDELPFLIKENINKKEFENIKKKFDSIGGIIKEKI